MANLSNSLYDIVDQFNQLTLEDEASCGLEVDALVDKGNGDFVDLRWTTVGRFLTQKSLNFVSMKNVLAFVWRLVCGMCVKELQNNLYLFQFFHERDVDRVLKNGPWSFEQNHF